MWLLHYTFPTICASKIPLLGSLLSTGSFLAVLCFFKSFKGSASTGIFTDFMSASTKVFAASLDPEARMNQ